MLGCTQTNEQMHMVLYAANGFWEPSNLPDNSPDIGMQPFSPWGSNARYPIFGAEYDVVMQ